MAANNPASPKSGLRRTGRAFWLRKLAGNKTRDRVVNRALRRAGWRVLRIWEHELAKKNEARLVQRIQRQIRYGHVAPRQYNLRSWFILSRQF
jgi:DNA mismatch endonuclease (patch repair protein)